MKSQKPRAVVLLSGGLDSTTTLAIARRQGYEIYAITFSYGQRHEIEVTAAERIAMFFNVARHITIDIDLRRFGGSALTDNIPVPKGRGSDEISHDIPSTYVPARNTIFLSLALAWAETLGACDIFIGVNALDYSGYPDCRPAYIEAFEKMADLATRAGVDGAHFTIHTPLINMTKAEIIRKGHELGVDFSMTSTCYDPSPDGSPCGQCDACILRQKGFAESGFADPLLYKKDGEHP
jgi:7-cyano-7-deazaguanine synthase